MSVTSLDVRTVTLVDHELVDEPLLTLDALADAADRLPAQLVEHHLADIPVCCRAARPRCSTRRRARSCAASGHNGCWVMLTALRATARLRTLLTVPPGASSSRSGRAARSIVGHNLVAFIGAPGATVPVHFDRNHHLLLQVRGTKTVGTGTFTDRSASRSSSSNGGCSSSGSTPTACPTTPRSTSSAPGRRS